ncbi:MAG: MCE family protein [Mycobacteriales bacterium]|jgi:phospholipid/cholesterol/gamma-HCH transport system substrate-binding protein
MAFGSRRSFAERNPVVIGAVGLAIIAALIVAAFNAENLPIIGGGTHYSAAFREAGGIKAGNEVRVAGVKVGKVDRISLERDPRLGQRVRVDFRVDHGTDLGSQTTASIRIKTVLGSKYLALDPQGAGSLRHGSEIPLSRTATPYDVLPALGDLAGEVGQIDTDQLAKAFDTLSSTFKDTPDEVKAALDGLSRLSSTISSRDAQLKQLLASAAQVTGVLADRDKQFAKLVSDANLVLDEVHKRRDVIHQLLVNTDELSRQLTGLVADNQQQLGPALANLRGVVGILRRNQDNLDRSLGELGPFVRVFSNVLGNGRWFDTYVAGLVPPTTLLPQLGGGH